MTPPLLVRRYAADLTRTDPRTLTGLAVPYDVVADVADLLPDGTVDAYREGFRSTAFTHAMAAPHRVRLKDGHADGTVGADLGIATAMRNVDAGLEVAFRVFDDQTAKVETLLDVGVSDLSVGFSPVKGGTHETGGVRWRTKAVLRHVALEPVGAYPGAEVLAYRDGDDLTEQLGAEYDAWLAEVVDFAAKARAEQDELLARYGTEVPGGE